MSEDRFGQIADVYDQTIPPHIAQHYLRKRVAFIGRLIKGGLVLDVGCGTGRLAGELEERGFRVVGVDSSKGMLGQMSKGKRGIPVQGVSTSLPFKSDKFDLVVSIAVFHHLIYKKRVAETIREMARVARPGGKILIWDHNPLNPYWPIFMKRLPQDSGRERLVYLKEILGDLSKSRSIVKVKAQKLGFVADFIPESLLPIFKILELCLEKLPLVRRILAHNVVVAQKRAGEF